MSRAVWTRWASFRHAAFAAMVGLSILACDQPEPARIGDGGQRIVLITVDTLRQDSFTGSSQHPTSMPLMAARAARGARFSRYFSATSTTLPSHASLLTGKHPWEHGVSRNGMLLPEQVDTVAEHLQVRGWDTAAIVASFTLDGRFNLDQGFAHYDDDFKLRLFKDHWKGIPIPQIRPYDLAKAVTDKALHRLRSMQGEHQFLWLHYFDPHSPYGDTAGHSLTMEKAYDLAAAGQPVGEEIARLRAAYELDIRSLDRELDRLFQQLDKDSDRFETHVVLVSDHGESFGESGSLGHGKRLTNEQIVVPLVILSPRIEAGERQDIVGSVDVAATLLALAGTNHRTSGTNLLLPPRAGRRAFGMRRTFAEPFSEQRTTGESVLLEPFRFYAVDRSGRIFRGNRESIDNSESIDAERLKALHTLFGYFEEKLETSAATVTLDAESRKALAALGYVD